MKNIRSHQTLLGRALQQYAIRAEQAGRTVEFALCHGTVCTVAFRWQDGQRGEAVPNDLCAALATKVAEQLRLRPDWVDTDVAAFIAGAHARHTLQPDEFGPGLTLTINEGARVLAHKLQLLGGPRPEASTDERDAEFLLHRIHLVSPGQVDRIHGRFYPGAALSPAALELIAAALQNQEADARA